MACVTLSDLRRPEITIVTYCGLTPLILAMSDLEVSVEFNRNEMMCDGRYPSRIRYLKVVIFLFVVTFVTIMV